MKRQQMCVAISPEARAELRTYAIERTQAEVEKTGDQAAHVGVCLAARLLLEEWASRRLRKREGRLPSTSNGEGERA